MFGPALKAMRNFRGLTAIDLAQELGYGHSWMYQVEGGWKSPSLAFLQDYASFYEVSLSSLIAFAEVLQDHSRPKDGICPKMYLIYDWATSKD